MADNIMTDEQFNEYFRIATGYNTMTADWVRSFKPNTYIGKAYLFIRLSGKIHLLYTIYSSDNTVTKYGRFDTVKDKGNDYTVGGYTIQGESSDLVKKLLELIFEDQAYGVKYVLSDEGEYVLLDNGEKIII